MKKYFLALFIILIVSLTKKTAKAQVSQDFANNNCIKTGTILIDAFYGWPYFNGTLLQSSINNGVGNNTYRVTNKNHLGGKVEYMLSENIGLGGEFTFADASINYQNSSNGRFEKAGIKKIRLLGRLNYHFATTHNLDPYFTAGLGFKKTTYYDSGSSQYDQTFNILPISFKLAVGLRFFFNDTFGITTEIGLGGPLLSAGLSVKL
jgi:outer membrane protein W